MSSAVRTLYAEDNALDADLTILSELPLGRSDPFWSAVLPYFDAARKAGHAEALAYDLRRSIADDETKRWIEGHASDIARYRKWAADLEAAGSR